MQRFEILMPPLGEDGVYFFEGGSVLLYLRVGLITYPFAFE